MENKIDSVVTFEEIRETFSNFLPDNTILVLTGLAFDDEGGMYPCISTTVNIKLHRVMIKALYEQKMNEDELRLWEEFSIGISKDGGKIEYDASKLNEYLDTVSSQLVYRIFVISENGATVIFENMKKELLPSVYKILEEHMDRNEYSFTQVGNINEQINEVKTEEDKILEDTIVGIANTTEDLEFQSFCQETLRSDNPKEHLVNHYTEGINKEWCLEMCPTLDEHV
jgi:hypothetical protein